MVRPQQIVIVMGVSGCGKTSVGRAVARQLKYDFHDADDYHSPENIAKIARNKPLTDSDRRPWLDALCQLLQRYSTLETSIVLACSALKRSYRQRLIESCPQAQIVYLKGPPGLISDRLQRRHHHFATVTLLESQFADLEEPTAEREGAFTIYIERSLSAIVNDIVWYLQRSPTYQAAHQAREFPENVNT